MADEIGRLLKEDPARGVDAAMHAYMGLCFMIVRTRLAGIGTKEDMEDCVSEAFMDLYEARDRFDLEKGTVKNFLAVLAARRASDCCRQLLKQQTASPEELELVGSRCPELEQLPGRMELLEALEGLGEPDREIFLRKYYLGQRTKEIARALNLRENTVDQKVGRGLKKLRVWLEGRRQ